MKTATKSSWSKVAQDLYGRWFVQESEQREKAATKEANKHKDGSLSPVRSSYFLPNLRLAISKFSNFPPKRCQTCCRPGKTQDFVLWRIFAHHLLKTIETTQVTANKKKKSAGSCLISWLWPALPAEWKQALLRPFTTKAETAESQGTEDGA